MNCHIVGMVQNNTNINVTSLAKIRCLKKVYNFINFELLIENF